MSTRCTIAIKRPSGCISSIYCHSDGYPSWTGKYLLQYYNHQLKIEQLLRLGNISILHPILTPDPNKPHTFERPQEGVTVAYERDRGETYEEAMLTDDISQFLRNCNYSYTYLYDTEQGKWYYRANSNETLKELTPGECNMDEGEDVVTEPAPKTVTPQAKRKVVQITVLSVQPSDWPVLYALCDDGTIWCRMVRDSSKWGLFNDVPQPGEDTKQFENRI
jgi:hypothetical protein